MPSRARHSPRDRLARLVAEQPGTRLPSERALSERFAIGRAALRQLLADFQARGLITRRHGSGTYAVDPATPRLARVAIVVDARIRLGDDPFFAAALEALQRELQAVQAQCQLLRHAPGQAAALVAAQCGDGALLMGSSCGALLASWPEDVPVVAWLAGPQAALGRHASVIELEDEAAGAAAVAYHRAGGRTRLRFIGHDQHPSPRLRLQGARSAAAAAGCELEVITSGMNYEDGVAAAAGLVASGGGETARLGVIAANDWLAAGVHVGLSRGGLNVAVIGFDGLPVALALGLPSLAVPIETIAADGVAELARLRLRPGISGRRLAYALQLHQAHLPSAAGGPPR